MMHYEHKNEDSVVHIYEVDGEQEKHLFDMDRNDYQLLWPTLLKYGEKLELPLETVYKMFKVQERPYCQACKDCVFWKHEEPGCSLSKPCVKFDKVHWRGLWAIDELLEIVRYATDEFIAKFKFVTEDAEILGHVPHDYFKCLQYLAEHEYVVGAIPVEEVYCR